MGNIFSATLKLRISHLSKKSGYSFENYFDDRQATKVPTPCSIVTLTISAGRYSLSSEKVNYFKGVGEGFYRGVIIICLEKG